MSVAPRALLSFSRLPSKDPVGVLSLNQADDAPTSWPSGRASHRAPTSTGTGKKGLLGYQQPICEWGGLCFLQGASGNDRGTGYLWEPPWSWRVLRPEWERRMPMAMGASLPCLSHDSWSHQSNCQKCSPFGERE